MNLDRLTFQIPWPSSALMPNRKHGNHWARTQGAKVSAKHDGYYAAKNALGLNALVPADRVAVRLTFAMPDRRPRDLDNLLHACKPALDGIAKGLGVDDKAFRPLILTDAIDADKKGFVLIEIQTGEGAWLSN